MYRIGQVVMWARPTTYVGIIVGGPVKLLGLTSSANLWTVRICDVDETETYLHPRRETQVVSTLDLSSIDWIYQTHPSWGYQNVIERWCPECDEEDSIFYGEDYICAWCREHLEDT